MSQYPPSPYAPPPAPTGYAEGGYYYGYPQQSDPLAPAKKASLLMFVLGGLFLLCGVGCGGMGLAAPWDEVMAQHPMADQLPPELTPELLTGIFIGMGVGVFVFGLLMVVLGYFVRGGGMGAVVSAAVVTGLALLGLLLLTLFGVIGAIANPQAILGVCFYLIPLALLGLLLTWLIQAARAVPSVAAMRQQQPQQNAAYWHYAQQQQAYQQAVYAYQQQQQQQQVQSDQSQQPPPAPPPPPAPGA